MCLLNQAATCPKGFDDVQRHMFFDTHLQHIF
jgi:chaperonin GroEL (HSP60 family)